LEFSVELETYFELETYSWVNELNWRGAGIYGDNDYLRGRFKTFMVK